MERPILTIIATALISLISLTYTVIYRSPEIFLNIWVFVILLLIFLTTALSTALYFLRKKLNAGEAEKPKIKVRKILLFSFTLSLLPALYLLIKMLNARSFINIALLISLIAVALFYVLRNNE